MNHYIYGHYKEDTGDLFYVGKGAKKRAWDTRGRNAHWKNVVAKHGLVVKILESDLTEEAAYIREQQLIEEIGLDKLVNIRPGGTGMRSEEASYIMRRNWQTPSFQQMQSDKNRKKDTWLPRLQAATKKNAELWQTPEWRNKMTEQRAQHLKSPEQREKCEGALRSAWQDDDFKQKMSSHRKNMWQDPEIRARLLRKEPCLRCGKVIPIRSMGSHNRKCDSP